MTDYEQFKELLQKSENDFREYFDTVECLKYLYFTDIENDELVIVARFRMTTNDSLIDIYVADSINSIDDFE